MSMISSVVNSLIRFLPLESTGMPISSTVSLPPVSPDPSAMAEFSARMQQQKGDFAVQSSEKINENNEFRPINGARTDSVKDTGFPEKIGKMNDVPSTLGERMATHGMEHSDGGATTKWLTEVTDIFKRNAISHADLYRVQVLAGMAHIEATRNSAVNNGIDNGLKTLLKNS